MRPIDLEAWTLLAEAGKSCPELPEELRKVLALPYADLVPLPAIDDADLKRGGGRFLPEWEEHAVDADRLEVLDEQIRREDGDTEGAGRLRRRRAALAPYVDRVLVRYFIRWERLEASIEIEAPSRKLVHFEIDRPDE